MEPTTICPSRLARFYLRRAGISYRETRGEICHYDSPKTGVEGALHLAKDGTWIDSSNGRSGDAWNLVADLEGMTIAEARSLGRALFMLVAERADAAIMDPLPLLKHPIPKTKTDSLMDSHRRRFEGKTPRKFK